jgi:hypothetical protein
MLYPNVWMFECLNASLNNMFWINVKYLIIVWDGNETEKYYFIKVANNFF